MIHTIFGRCLEGGTLSAHIDTVDHADALFFGYGVGHVAQLLVVSLMHVGETGTGGEVLAMQRMLREEVDVVVNDTFAALKEPRLIITTEKDATRLLLTDGLSQDVRQHLYVQPIEVAFLNGQQESFNNKIISYVREN